VLFNVNMCRASVERHQTEQRRARNVAYSAVILGVNLVVLVLFLQAIAVTGSYLGSAEAQLVSTNRALQQVTEKEGNITPQQIRILQARRARVDWHDTLLAIGRLTPRDVWLTRLAVSEGTPAGGGDPIPGLRVFGRMKADREEEGVTRLMSFVQELRAEARFREEFLEATLVTVGWTSDFDEGGVEFEIFCPLVNPTAAEVAYEGS